MAVFTDALSVLLGICYVGLPMASGEEPILLLGYLSPLIYARNALDDIGSRLNEVNHDINPEVWNIDLKGFHEQELRTLGAKALYRQKDSYEDLADAQEQRLKLETQLNDNKNTASPRELAQPDADRNQLNNIINYAKQTPQNIHSKDSGNVSLQYHPKPPQGNGGGGGENGGDPSSPQAPENALKAAMGVINAAGKEISTKYGQELGNLTNFLSSSIQGKKIRNYQDAMNHFEQIRSKPNMKVSKADQMTIGNAVNALDKRSMGEALTRLGKAFGLADPGFKAESIYNKTEKGFRSGIWSPLFLEVEDIAFRGIAARSALSFLASALLPVAATMALPASVGFSAAAILTGVISSFIDGSAADAFNNLVIPSAH